MFWSENTGFQDRIRFITWFVIKRVCLDDSDTNCVIVEEVDVHSQGGLLRSLCNEL